MNLKPGTRLGPYEILAPVGAGGMGEVYRARDTRLGRDVAVKILPAEFARSARLRTRFEREAKTISQLAHPNICTLFDVGDGYLVMELLEGESLAARLARGPLPLEQIVRYGIETCEALHQAHRRGIVHRDLKPGNIMLTKSGAKLLDFGLSKTAPIVEASPDDETRREPLTQEGVFLGTLPYMAPEQLEGRDADARSDIFSLGAVLYEMATGRRAFAATSRASLIVEIVDRDPAPISEVQPMTPRALERIIKTCLAKQPDDRWQNAHDVGEALRWVTDAAPPPRKTSRKAVAVAALIAGIVVGGGLTWWAARAPNARTSMRLTLPAAARAPYRFGTELNLAISPDGSRIAYAGGDDGQIFVRRLDRFDPQPIAGVTHAREPLFAQDGQSIFYFADRAIRRVPIDGGVPATIVAARIPLGLTVSNDTIYYVRNFPEGIWAAPVAGGAPRLLAKTNLSRGFRAYLWPDVVADGRALLFTAWTGRSWDEAKIIVRSLATGEERVVVDGGSCARWSPSGHILFGRGGTLFAVPFDAKSLRVTGAPQPVMNGIATGTSNGEVHYAVSGNGSITFVAGGVIEQRNALLWLHRDGRTEPVVPTLRAYGAGDPDSPSVALSPDGRSVGVGIEGSTFDVWQLDIERDLLTRVSFGDDDMGPLWTADGKRMIWRSSRNGVYNLYWSPTDGSGREERLTASPRHETAQSISPDGRFLLTIEGSAADTDIDVIDLQGDHTPRPFVASEFRERSPRFSPDGKWVAYVSNESGRDEVYVRPFPGPGGKWQVSTNGGSRPVWSRSGREILYIDPAEELCAVSMEMQPAVRIGKPSVLVANMKNRTIDAGRDDDHYLVVQTPAPPSSNEIRLITNWSP